MFHLIDEYSKIFFTTLFSLSKEQISAIASEVMHPVNDGIPVVSIYNRLKKSKMPDKLKVRALKFMKPAFEKERETIEQWEKLNKKKWSYPAWEKFSK